VEYYWGFGAAQKWTKYGQGMLTKAVQAAYKIHKISALEPG